MVIEAAMASGALHASTRTAAAARYPTARVAVRSGRVLAVIASPDRQHAHTGKSILTFGKNGLVDLREGLGRDPKAIARIQPENPGAPVPIDLVTRSASGLDPHITPAAAEFQLPTVAKERGTTVDQLRTLLAKHTEDRQFGFLGEPRVNVLELNLDLDERFPKAKQASIQ